MDWVLFWAILMILPVIIRVKYIWQGNKIRRRRSSKDVSRKFMIWGTLSYLITFSRNVTIKDTFDIIFLGFGFVACIYCLTMMYIYRHPKVSLLRWLKDGVSSKEEGGWFF